MNAQILIKCGDNWFEFSKSKTGQLDYEGKLENVALSEIEGYQEITSSSYFTPSWYVHLQHEMSSTAKIYVAPGVDVSGKDVFGFLVHIGAILSAIEAKDSLLAGELFLRRMYCFENFAPLVQYIMEPLCVEILFSLCYGRMQNMDPEEIPLVFNSAKKNLGYMPEKESLDQAFIRYFKENKVTITMPVVGTNFHGWNSDPMVLEKLTDNLNSENVLGSAEKIRKAKHDLYESLETSVQAEPYNPHDKNAILVCIENIEAKISGNPGLEKVGYVRALAAKVIREAKCEKMSYDGKLCRISHREIVVRMTV